MNYTQRYIYILPLDLHLIVNRMFYFELRWKLFLKSQGAKGYGPGG